MQTLIPFLARWAGWLVILSCESVVGFPWLSMYGLFEWIVSLDQEKALPSIAVAGIFLAAAYSLPLSVVVGVLLAAWYLCSQVPRRSWQRTAVYGVAACVLGVAAHVPLQGLPLVSALLTGGVFLGLKRQKKWSPSRVLQRGRE